MNHIKRNKHHGRSQGNGFTLTEMLATTAIISSLAAVAVPTYLGEKKASCQGYPESIINQTMMQVQAYNDEYGAGPTSWSDLNRIATLMTKNGPATEESFDWIELVQCGYKLKVLGSGNTYTFISAQTGAIIDDPQVSESNIKAENNTYNVIGCLNTLTGASDIQRGDGTTAAELSTLSCAQS